MKTSIAKLHQQVRDFPDFLIFWDDLYEAQQRFVLVSHGFPENSHQTAQTNESFKQTLLQDFEIWHSRKSVPSSAFYKSRVRPAFLTFMQSMPLIQNLYQRCPELSVLEIRMLCSQLEIQTDIIFSARHQISSLSSDEQRQLLSSYSFIEDIREDIKINSRNITRGNQQDSCGSRNLSLIKTVHQQSQDTHPPGYFIPARELAISPKVPNIQTITLQQSKMNFSAHDSKARNGNMISETQKGHHIHPAELKSVRELAKESESSNQQISSISVHNPSSNESSSNSKLNQPRESLSSLDLAAKSTDDDPEKLKEKEMIDKTRTRRTQKIRPSNIRNRKQHKAQLYFEPLNLPIIVKKIAAHRQLICQTIQGRQRKKKKYQVTILFLWQC